MKNPKPRVSYNRLTKIIEAYYEIEKDVVSTKEIYDFTLKRIDYGDITGSAKFLVFINLLEPRKPQGFYKITSKCKDLGRAFSTSDVKKEEAIFKEIIKTSQILQKVYQRIQYLVKLSGSIKLDDLKKEIIKLFDWEESIKKNYDANALTIIDLFKAAKLVTQVNSTTFNLTHFQSPIEFISTNYIENLNTLNSTSNFDLTRLIYYCEQVNYNYSNSHYESVAFLSRAIIHHVPPIFDQKNFQSLCSQSENGKDSSFKKSCVNLQSSLKHIVDDLIHRPISNSETPLAEQEINFSQDLNRLIRGVIDKINSKNISTGSI
jgi:hypothetical protein